MIRKALVPAFAMLACGAFSAVVAQSIEGLDLGAIESRAAEHAAEAQALFDFATANAEVQQEDAREVVDAGHEAMRGVDPGMGGDSAGPVDFDAMLAGAQGLNAAPEGAPLFIAFASLSMPEDALRRLIADTTRAGGVVVFRGLSAGSPQAFMQGIQKVVSQQGASNMAIDPRLFRAFGVDRVPTYVALSRSFEPCDQLVCTSQTPPYDKISGNVSAQYALTTFVEGNGPGAAVSRTALTNLGRTS